MLKESMIHTGFGAIPPTQLVVRSYSAYRDCAGVANPTNAVGGAFISELALIGRKERRGRLGMKEPPTALLGFQDTQRSCCRLSMNAPPTALVGLSAEALFTFSASG